MRCLEVEVLYRDEGVAIGTCGCIVLFAWRGDVTLERVAAADPIIRARAAACGRAIALLNVIEDGSEPPHGEPARRIAVTLEELGERLVGAAMVFEEGSTWLARALDEVMSVTAAMGWAVTQKHTVCRAEACLWVHRRCRAAGELETPTCEELAEALCIVQSAIVAQ